MTELPPPIFKPFESQGGIADLTTIDDDIKLFWQLPMRYLRDALSPARRSPSHPDEEFPSYLAYINNTGFNAAIRHEQDAVAAGIFVAIPMVALQACRLFALRMDQATGLPRCDSEQRLVVFDHRIELPTQWGGAINPADSASKDLKRFEEQTDLLNNEFALFMFDIAMRYVAMHECMHFALGHARYCQMQLGLDTFEDGTVHRAALDPVTSQTLEYIADRHTIAGLVEDLDQGRLFHDWCRETPEFVMVAPQVWHRRVLVATLTLISRLWTNHISRSVGDLSNPYPHPYERVCWMVNGLSEMDKKGLAQEFQLSFALSVCSLDRNFKTQRNDIPLLESDMALFNRLGHSVLDNSFNAVRERAVAIQKAVYQQYGPHYPSADQAIAK